MNLNLVPDNVPAYFVFLLGLSFAVAIIAFVLLLSARRMWIMIINLALMVVSVGFVVAFGIMYSTMLHNHAVANQHALQASVKQEYGLTLSADQAKQLNPYGIDSDTAKFGATLLRQGEQVTKVELVKVAGTYLLINSGTRNELPHA